MAKSRDYWINRYNLLQSAELSKADKQVAEIERMYRRALKDIEKDIATWYNRFAANQEIDLAEAKKLLIGKELKEFQWTVEEYIEKGKENVVDHLWVKELENASARIHVTRFEALKLQMQQHVEFLYGNQLDDLDDLARNLYTERYYRTAFETQLGFNMGWAVNELNTNLIDAVIKKPWAPDGVNFSERVWANRSKLVSTLHTELTHSIIRGENPNSLIKAIAKKMDVSKRAAGRLVMTEAAFFASAGQKKAYDDLDVEKYEYVATLDGKTSEICQEMDGKIFTMDQYAVGSTAPPLHVFCRSVTAPWFDDNYTERAARRADGKTYYVPSDTTYPQWKEDFMGKTDPETAGFKPLEINLPVTTDAIAQAIADAAQLKEGADLTGVSPEVALKIQERYNRVMDRYPQLVGEFRSLGIRETRGSTYASCYVGSGQIDVNTHYFKEAETLAKNYNKDLASGFHPEGTDGYSIITHEIGHAVDGYLSRNGVGEFKGWNRINASTIIRQRALKELKLALKHVRNGVSGYATKNDSELFAEAFAEYLDSPEPRPIAKKIGEIIDEHMENIRKGVK